MHEGITEDVFKLIRKNKEEEKEQDTAEIKKLLHQFCQNVESQIGPPCVNLVSEIIVKEGYPAEEILNTADDKECDVIVLGTHGKGWLKHDLSRKRGQFSAGEDPKTGFYHPASIREEQLLKWVGSETRIADDVVIPS